MPVNMEQTAIAEVPRDGKFSTVVRTYCMMTRNIHCSLERVTRSDDRNKLIYMAITERIT
jgi:hypothetical protein